MRIFFKKMVVSHLPSSENMDRALLTRSETTKLGGAESPVPICFLSSWASWVLTRTSGHSGLVTQAQSLCSTPRAASARTPRSFQQLSCLLPRLRGGREPMPLKFDLEMRYLILDIEEKENIAPGFYFGYFLWSKAWDTCKIKVSYDTLGDSLKVKWVFQFTVGKNLSAPSLSSGFLGKCPLLQLLK